MINIYKTDEKFRHIFGITVVYFFAQGFLLVVSGTWWDDWVYVNKNWEYLYEVMLQSSLPLQAYIDASLWLLPDGAYRILVFLYFYLGSILIYMILKKIDVFSPEDSFWITLLYITIPIYDARIMWICYGYSLGLFAFWISFYLVTLWQEKRGKKAILMRILSLMVLVFSFNTESIMLMTLAILLYLYYEELKVGWKWRELKKNVIKCCKVVFHYADFLMAPIVFYFGKHRLFPSYGVYAGHNYVNWRMLPGLLVRSPFYAFETMKRVFDGYSAVMSRFIWGIISFAAVAGCLVIRFVKSRKGNPLLKADKNFGKSLIMLFVGIFLFYIGFFPYVIRCEGSILTTSIEGRNALLLGIGMAMIFYYALIVLLNPNLVKATYVFLIALGVCHFNDMYLDWQEDYYQQLRFEAEIAENEDILTNDTFLCLFHYPPYIGSFYQFTGNSRTATGEETRYYLTIDKLAALPDFTEETWTLRAFNIRDWDYTPDNLHIDGILFFNNTPIGNGELIVLKLQELFNKKDFNQWIMDTKDITFIPVTVEESDAMVKAAQAGLLTQDNIGDYVEAYPIE